MRARKEAAAEVAAGPEGASSAEPALGKEGRRRPQLWQALQGAVAVFLAKPDGGWRPIHLISISISMPIQRPSTDLPTGFRHVYFDVLVPFDYSQVCELPWGSETCGPFQRISKVV